MFDYKVVNKNILSTLKYHKENTTAYISLDFNQNKFVINTN